MNENKMVQEKTVSFSSSNKIKQHHLERLAIVYIRQSSIQQVSNNVESTQLQYNLKYRAENLGWSKQRVITIDEDLGRSASTVEGRSGFQRLVAEVGLNHVGIILGIEMSRLARSCKDWHQLLEICAMCNRSGGNQCLKKQNSMLITELPLKYKQKREVKI